MALRGTLKDFGIADIFQLIGHQQKTGILGVKNKDSEVQIYFQDGAVVRAESSTRQKRDLLGRMLVRAEVLSEEQLSRALETQKRTLKRLGQILVESGFVDKKSLRTFTKLQTSETIYRLFLWESGTYEFSQQDIQVDADVETIRSESVLMEGFRQVDEWPAIRKKITGYGTTFDKLKDLDSMLAAAPADEMAGLDDAFGEFNDSAPKSGGLKNIGANERVIYQLITAERDVQKIIDLSRLGEFETCKALVSLIDAEVIREAAEQPKRSPSAEATVGGISVKQGSPVLPILTRVFLSLALVVAAAVGLKMVAPQLRTMTGAKESGYWDLSVQSELAVAQMQKIQQALALYQTRHGKYPDGLADLVHGGMLVDRDLMFPWQSPYYYMRLGETYELVRPLY